MTISLFQRDKECLLWTRDEIERSNVNRKSILGDDMYIPISLNGHDIKLFCDNSFIWFVENKTEEVEKYLSDINVIVLYQPHEGSQFEKLLARFKRHSDKKFVLIYKFVEEYYITMRTMKSELPLELLNENPNLRVLWDIDTNQFSNFIFHPKLAFHHYHNQPLFQYGIIFELGYEVFKGWNKRYRIGFHMNKNQFELRKKLWDMFSAVLPNDRVIGTNSEEFESEFFDSTLRNRNTIPTSDWYLRQFLELTIKSEMEFVYETHTPSSPNVWCNKWTEKTNKLLLLGKPFIHSDPIAFALAKVYSLHNYQSLYTPQLWEYFSKFSHNDYIFFNDPPKCTIDRRVLFFLLEENLHWLMNMNDDEWKERIDIANKQAEENRLHIHNLIYNTSLLPLITSPQLFN